MLTKLGLYKLWGENPERAWPFGRQVAIPICGSSRRAMATGTTGCLSRAGWLSPPTTSRRSIPAILGVHSRRQLYYMAKIELLEVPIAGEILRWTGAFAVRRGEGDRDSIRMARWAVSHGHGLGVFAEGTRQPFGHPGPLHPGAVMIAVQEGVPVVPCGIDTFGWSPKNRRACCVVWGDPITLDLPRNGKGYKEGTAIVEERVPRALAAGRAGGRRRVSGDTRRRRGAVQAGPGARAVRLPRSAEMADDGVGRRPARAGLPR